MVDNPRLTAVLLLTGLSLATCRIAFGDDQALGDVARQQRQQQAAKSHQPRKIVTNDDIPGRTESDADEKPDNQAEPVSALKPGASAERVKAVIQVQKTRVAALKAQIDKLSASIHYVEANRYSNGVQYNQYQRQKQQEVDRMRQQLMQEQTKLADMQEAARKAGFGSAVYDP